MLDYLREVEERLPYMLKEGHEAWNSLYVDYHYPYVKRLWRQDGDNRIYLHAIEVAPQGSKVLFHPHPWPSAMKIVGWNSYEMGIGHGPGIIEPKVTMKFILPKDSYYEMTDIDSWHYVSPVVDDWRNGTHAFSLMVTGKPWEREIPKGPAKKLEPLSLDQKLSVFNKFACLYPDPNSL